MIGMDNNMSCLLDVESGASDAALMDETVANYLIETGGRDLRVMGDFLYAENYVIGFRKGETQLADAVNNALVELKADGTLAEISTKWFGSDITTVEAPAETQIALLNLVIPAQTKSGFLSALFLRQGFLLRFPML